MYIPNSAAGQSLARRRYWWRDRAPLPSSPLQSPANQALSAAARLSLQTTRCTHGAPEALVLKNGAGERAEVRGPRSQGLQVGRHQQPQCAPARPPRGQSASDCHGRGRAAPTMHARNFAIHTLQVWGSWAWRLRGAQQLLSLAGTARQPSSGSRRSSGSGRVIAMVKSPPRSRPQGWGSKMDRRRVHFKRAAGGGRLLGSPLQCWACKQKTAQRA